MKHTDRAAGRLYILQIPFKLEIPLYYGNSVRF